MDIFSQLKFLFCDDILEAKGVIIIQDDSILLTEKYTETYTTHGKKRYKKKTQHMTVNIKEHDMVLQVGLGDRGKIHQWAALNQENQTICDYMLFMIHDNILFVTFVELKRSLKREWSKIPLKTKQNVPEGEQLRRSKILLDSLLSAYEIEYEEKFPIKIEEKYVLIYERFQPRINILRTRKRLEDIEKIIEYKKIKVKIWVGIKEAAIRQLYQH